MLINPGIGSGLGVGAAGANNQATVSDYIQAGNFLKDTSFLHIQALLGLHSLMANNLSDEGSGSGFLGSMSGGMCPNDPDNDRDPAKDKKLSKGEIRKLKRSGYDVHDLKGGKNASRFDLFKDKKGNIYVKPKSGSGPGDPLGINIRGL